MFEYFLALVALAHLDTVAPNIQAPYRDYSECAVAAAKANKQLIQPTKENIEAGMQFVCLKLVAPV